MEVTQRSKKRQFLTIIASRVYGQFPAHSRRSIKMSEGLNILVETELDVTGIKNKFDEKSLEFFLGEPETKGWNFF